MFGLVVFGALSLGMTSLVIHSMRSAHSNIMRNTAYTTAQSFLEQIEGSIAEVDLVAALDDPTVASIPTKSVSSAKDLNKGGTVDPIFLNDPSPSAKGPNHKQILIDLKDNHAAVLMDMWFDIKITELQHGEGYFITLEFWFESAGMPSIPTQHGVLQTIRNKGRTS